MAVQPTRPLVLTAAQHVLLGELVEIMGLIEDLLIESAERVDSVAAAKLRKLTAAPQADEWVKAITGKINDPSAAALLSAAQLELAQVAEDRNDFNHALYAGVYVRGYVQPGYQATTATRSKTGNSRSTCELAKIRDRAAALSCVVDTIADSI
ncbi:hypothetical protein [Bradyrhizobium sp. BR 10289]|uniref:hypothetical protein n=1 Tax=Bradyrhizobium sp. BR 10289 TaxID=2749993 RepID=UPI001C646C6F|nr:hypothetical protein [Bradyrhizobium sp. BR 10289]MBW7968624.1 hypothetical protein [Bradyrhizobium sp. BR 10289]